MKRTLAAALATVVLSFNTAHAQDAATLARIRDEGMNRSHVVEMFNHLTNVIGPRLTGSPAFKQSIDWSVATLNQYGLSKVHTEAWPYGRGWTLEKFTLEMVEPRYFPLIGFPEAWTPSMPREITASPVYIGALANADSVKARGSSLKGAIVLATKPQEAFITKDRLQPTESEQAVPIGAPRAN
ncbi:MAG: peptidase, partial [Gemmatimonadetes bacterium]|nr:peptidase [Gemmatimonadota bacterium]